MRPRDIRKAIANGAEVILRMPMRGNTYEVTIDGKASIISKRAFNLILEEYDYKADMWAGEHFYDYHIEA